MLVSESIMAMVKVKQYQLKKLAMSRRLSAVRRVNWLAPRPGYTAECHKRLRPRSEGHPECGKLGAGRALTLMPFGCVARLGWREWSATERVWINMPVKEDMVAMATVV